MLDAVGVARPRGWASNHDGRALRCRIGRNQPGMARRAPRILFLAASGAADPAAAG
jgi:hypothetical protein